MTHRREFVYLSVIFLLGLTLRLVSLCSESIWLDEAFSIDMAKNSVAAIWRGDVLDPGNPPLYYILLHYWMDFFGPTIESARAFSGVAGALGIVATWLLAKACGCAPSVRLLASFLVAVSPSLIYLSRETRVYTLFALVVMLAAAAAEVIVRNGGRLDRQTIPAWIAFTVLGASFSYLHYYSFLLLAVFGLYLFFRLSFDGWKLLATLMISYAVIVAAFLPWLSLFRTQIGYGTTRGGSTWIMHLAVAPLYSLAGHTLVWKENGMAIVALLSGAALLAVYLPSIYWAIREERLPLLPVFLPVGLIAVAILISVTKSPMLQSRYLSVIFPCLMIIIAAGLVSGFKRFPNGALFASLVLFGLMGTSLVRLYAQSHKEDWRPIASYVKRTNSSLPVYCYEDVARLSFNYYAPDIKVRPIDPVAVPFAPKGEPWQTSGLLDQMNGDKEGFWFILYLSLPETMPHLDEINDWLREHFEVKSEFGDSLKDPVFPLIHVYELKPR
ncbi:glycosyltransferase family 39 protein [bacterium]|nr:glycosyltransferase family 39 protein [bacterium]